MKAAVSYIATVLIFVLLASCGSEQGENHFYNLATQYMGQGNWEKAEQNFTQVIEQFPNGQYASKSLFMVGYINANHLNNHDKASKYYAQFVDKYPDHELADDAQYELDNMGKGVDELPFLSGDSQGNDSDSKPESNPPAESKD